MLCSDDVMRCYGVCGMVCCEYNRKFGLPIIADEIYGGCVFDGVFTSVSAVSGEVPVLVVGGK